jgi:hypothetical protein
MPSWRDHAGATAFTLMVALIIWSSCGGSFGGGGTSSVGVAVERRGADVRVVLPAGASLACYAPRVRLAAMVRC